MHRTLLALIAVVLCGGLLTACGGADKSGPQPTAAGSGASASADPGEGGLGAPGASGGPTSGPAASPTAKKKTVAALTCGQLKVAQVGSAAVKYNGYPDYIPLVEGRWAGEDGATVELQAPCGIGDLNGDDAADAVGVVKLTTGGTGSFWTLVVWRNVAGSPTYLTLADLGDRNPVISIGVAAGKATVVYYTRTSEAPMAQLNLKRTAVYKLAGTAFTELSHTDAPYSG